MMRARQEGKADKPQPVHIPALDGCRAIAIFLVLAGHFARPVAKYLPDATSGVRLFFVLSGFLITGILMDIREEAARYRQSHSVSLRQFYIRRMIRILPIYYVTVAFCIIVGFDGIREHWLLLVTYTSNWYTTLTGLWLDSTVGPFWSLAVEEQFYLVWPLIILLFPRRMLLHAVLAGMVLGWVGRVAMVIMGCNSEQIHASSLCALDALAGGGLLAYVYRNPGSIRWSRTWGNLLAGLAAIIVVWLRAQRVMASEVVLAYVLLHDPLVTALSMWLIAACAVSRPATWLALLSWQPITYIGRISYGLYVYHMVIHGTMRLFFAKVGWIWDRYEILRVLLQLAVTFCVATLSWHLFECPISRLKRHVPYVLKRRPGANAGNRQPLGATIPCTSTATDVTS